MAETILINQTDKPVSPAAGQTALSAPTGANQLRWQDGDNGTSVIAGGGYTLTVPATGTAALRGVANTFAEEVTISPPAADDVPLTLNTAASPTGAAQVWKRDGTHKITLHLDDNNFVVEHRNFVALADNGTITLPYAVYKLEVIDASGGSYAEFFCRGAVNSVTELVDVGTLYTTTKDNAGTFNVYYESSAYIIQNKRGLSRNLAIKLIRGTSTA